MFTSILSSAGLTYEAAVICTMASLCLGAVIAALYKLQNDCSKNYLMTLVILPALVQVIIMMVNGDLGTGVAIMGAFSLIRYRSIPGSAREIMGIFFAMVVGVATGSGYVTFAVFTVILVGAVMVLLGRSNIGERNNKERELKVTIAEDLDYTDIFDDLFAQYTTSHDLRRVKTTNMGSMYELRYQIRLKDPKEEKKFIDDIRMRNGNLNVVCGRPTYENEL